MFSVIIPLYNKAATIAGTLQTVLNQTYSNYEVIIVNDGSTDAGVAIVEDLTNDERITIIEQPNQGVSAARNKGVLHAKFDYIAFLDGDDEWKPQYLETLKLAIDQNPGAGMFCSAGCVRNNTGISPRLAKKYAGKIIPVNFFENPHVFMHTSATVVTSKVFKEAGGFPVGIKRNEDFAFFFSVAFLTPVVYVGKALSIYVGDVAGQATSSQPAQAIHDIVRRHNIISANYRKWKIRNKTYKIFLRYEIRHDLKIRIHNKDHQSIKYLLQNLDKDILNSFPFYEMNLYRVKFLNRLSRLYITCTKLRWRLRNYPFVGQVEADMQNCS